MKKSLHRKVLRTCGRDSGNVVLFAAGKGMIRAANDVVFEMRVAA